MADVIIIIVYSLMMCANSFRHVHNDPRLASIIIRWLQYYYIPCPAGTIVDSTRTTHDYDDDVMLNDNIMSLLL